MVIKAILNNVNKIVKNKNSFNSCCKFLKNKLNFSNSDQPPNKKSEKADMISAFLLFIQHCISCFNNLFHSHPVHTLQIIAAVLHSVRTSLTRRLCRNYYSILCIRTIKLRIRRPVHSNDSTFWLIATCIGPLSLVIIKQQRRIAAAARQ